MDKSYNLVEASTLSLENKLKFKNDEKYFEQS